MTVAGETHCQAAGPLLNKKNGQFMFERLLELHQLPAGFEEA
jgi:hypothetical protein